MTKSDEWMLGLALVYGLPSFLIGVAVTLLIQRWRNGRQQR
jgi:hypothetical protein